MDNKWEEMYIAAKTVQNERKISKYVEAGTVAAAILSTKNKIYTGVCMIHALHWEYAQKEMQFSI